MHIIFVFFLIEKAIICLNRSTFNEISDFSAFYFKRKWLLNLINKNIYHEFRNDKCALLIFSSMESIAYTKFLKAQWIYWSIHNESIGVFDLPIENLLWCIRISLEKSTTKICVEICTCKNLPQNNRITLARNW